MNFLDHFVHPLKKKKKKKVLDIDKTRMKYIMELIIRDERCETVFGIFNREISWSIMWRARCSMFQCLSAFKLVAKF